jgi:hypothetical protein
MKTPFFCYSSCPNNYKEMGMKQLLPILAVSSMMIIPACNKTQKATMTSTADATPEFEMDLDVEVVVDGDGMIVTMNGEEVEELPNGMMAHVMQMIGDDGGEVIIMVNGEEVNTQGGDMMEHVMRMIGDEGGEHPMQIMRMMRMHGAPDKTMRGHDKDGGPREIRGEWHSNPRQEASEEKQFMQELGMLGDVATYLSDSNSVAMMGIHMIRDTLDGATRLQALEMIIEEELPGSASRNAALIVAIQTLQEDGDIEAAADLMVELVLSN